MSATRLGVATLIAGLVVTSVAASAGGIRHRDSVGDVKGGPGPDVTAVTAFEQAGRIKFRVEFAKAPPLGFSSRVGYTDMLIVTIWPAGKVDPKRQHYFLGVHGADLKHVGWGSYPKKGSGSLEPAVVSGKSVTLSLDPHLIGDPKKIRFSVAAGREMNEGTGGGDDLAPDRGTWLWVR